MSDQPVEEVTQVFEIDVKVVGSKEGIKALLESMMETVTQSTPQGNATMVSASSTKGKLDGKIKRIV